MQVVLISCDRCGWASKAKSRTGAERGYRMHSCQRQRARAAAAERGAARLAGIDRTPVPCRHKQARHRHGTDAAYKLDRCHCLPCAAAHTAYESNRVRQRAYGRQAYVDAGPARAHVLALMAAGMGRRTVVAASGVSDGSLSLLLHGRRGAGGNHVPSARIREATAAALLALDVDLAAGARTDATGTRRRLQALIAVGWTRAELARRLGVSPQNFATLLTGAAVLQRTADAARQLYDDVSMTSPAAAGAPLGISRSRAAAAAGWVPPLAWDDDDLDDPAAKPAGDPTYLADIRGPVAAQHRRGLNDREIAAALNRSRHTVAAVRAQLGLPPNHGSRAAA